ncbi:hypothetical protein [Micromonospora sp. HUAS LYJ1]|uniref:hypothetical protein n=1 Tax=Micromonospora sp. HUAS LYJ1 TaxID=3061626 RepID=UPI002672DC17|nr:hypothetical protein [Micromonospora sp. HUAS LYJ1]WKU05339.1 hypothetical protein Q2K16_32155 [Micromonospora sp. HUAS LYJ1]
MTTAALHELLLRLAGNTSDELTTGAREELAAGRADVAARLIASTAGNGWFRPTDDDLALLRSADPTVALPPYAPGSGADWEFAPTIPVEDAPGVVALDLSGDGPPGDVADRTAVRSTAGMDGAVALWCAWRAPYELNPDIGRVYLLLTNDAPDRLPGVTGELQAALRTAGIGQPQVEVFRPDTELPWYQRQARGRSALLWARTPPTPVTIARDFDTIDPVLGPGFDPDHDHLEAAEAAQVLGYLDAGEPLLSTTTREPDVLDTSLGQVVPQSFRTDGTWIWTDTVAYYLRTYGLAPDGEFLAHIRDRGYQSTSIDDVLRHRALVELFRPVTERA